MIHAAYAVLSDPGDGEGLRRAMSQEAAAADAELQSQLDAQALPGFTRVQRVPAAMRPRSRNSPPDPIPVCGRREHFQTANSDAVGGLFLIEPPSSGDGRPAASENRAAPRSRCRAAWVGQQSSSQRKLPAGARTKHVERARNTPSAPRPQNGSGWFRRDDPALTAV